MKCKKKSCNLSGANLLVNLTDGGIILMIAHGVRVLVTAFLGHVALAVVRGDYAGELNIKNIYNLEFIC